MKQTNSRNIILICLFVIVACLFLLILMPQIRQIIINMMEHLMGREIFSQAKWHRFLRYLSIIIIVILIVLLFLKYIFNIDYMKYFIQMTNGSLYSGKNKIPTTEISNINTPTMIEKIKNNSWLVFSVCAVFIILLVFFTVAHPIVPFDADDWLYLGGFGHPFPIIGAWNPSRVFPGVSIPFAGLFAAYIVNPILGDYLTSISFTVAVIVAIFTTVFYWSLYRLFLSITGDKIISISSGLIVLCLCFVFFKTQEEGSQYMLYAHNLCTYFFYTIPNLLNSILTCMFMHFAACGTNISIKGLGRTTFIFVAITLYFAIFSMLYSVIILAVYCFWQLFISITQKEKITKNFALIIILAGFLVYMILEFTGRRAAWTIRETGNYSFFSLEYLRHCKEALINLLGLVRQIQGILFVTLPINFFAIALLRFNIAEDKNKPLIKTGIISLLGFVSLIPAMVMVAGRSNPFHAGNIEYMYSIFFYYILFSMLSMIYILTKLKIAAVILPFFLVFFFLETTNTNMPYSKQPDYAIHYFGHDITTRQKIDLTNNWIEQVKIADKDHAESVTIIIPESSYPNGWPIALESFPGYFSQSLYVHGITSRRITILLQPDRKMTEEL